MNFQETIAAAWAKIVGLIDSFILILPNLVLAAIAFAAFFFAARWLKIKEYEGTVENIQTRATTIRTYDGRRIVIPNSELFTNSVTVNTAFESRRMEYDIGIGYGDNIDKAKRLMLEAIYSVDEVLRDPSPDVLALELAESSVNIRARWWIKPPRRIDDLSSRDKVISAIKQKLYVENGIDLPYPTRQILFHDQTEETDGDRSSQREGWPAGNNEVPQARGISDSLRSIAQMRASRNGSNNNQKTDETQTMTDHEKCQTRQTLGLASF
ncbi:MAG: mechanosensitive ion channel family protein [Pleurocapsa sp. CRU_1_2]|nr:mechanosensitive ion channel family protein [Pleurocapsa sp. CRU_1_2]